jgi:hypothetical protein
VVNEERAVGRAENTCRTIKDGDDDATVQHMAELRFKGGDVPELSSDQTAQIVTAIKGTFCE